MPQNTKKGTIKILKAGKGLGFLSPEGTAELLPFTFDKIVSYKGQSLQELSKQGIRVGSTVTFVEKDSQGIGEQMAMLVTAVKVGEG